MAACVFAADLTSKDLPIGTLRKASRQQKKNADLLDALEVLRKDPTL